jgi:hypothetical protein
MRTSIIPAQITTVEDKIAGNLNMTQIGILMVPVFLGTAIYCFFPPFMHFAIYKVVVVAFIVIVALLLALRIKGKVVANWLGVLFTYNQRARYYIFNKNDVYQRELYLPTVKKVSQKAVLQKEAKATTEIVSKDLLKLKRYIKNPKYALSLKPKKKGGFYVALNEIEL